MQSKVSIVNDAVGFKRFKPAAFVFRFLNVLLVALSFLSRFSCKQDIQNCTGSSHRMMCLNFEFTARFDGSTTENIDNTERKATGFKRFKPTALYFVILNGRL